MKTKIFCLPYAGASKNIYYDWVKIKSNKEFEFIPIEYKGHGSRYNEGFYSSFDDILQDLMNLICVNTKDENCKYIILGHSLGALLTFHLCLNIENSNKTPPICIVLSSSEPPRKLKNMDTNKNTILEKIYKMGHIPEAIYNNKEVYKIYSEIIYKDVLIDYDCNMQYNSKKVMVPIIGLYGQNDNSINPKIFKNWRNCTFSKCLIERCKGDHFFIFEKDFDIIHCIKTALNYIHLTEEN